MIKEAQIANEVMKILAGIPDGEASIQTLIHELSKRLSLSEDDTEASPSRTNEERWEQRVRNITSHKNASTNAIHLGLLEPIDGGLKLTDKGRAHLKSLK